MTLTHPYPFADGEICRPCLSLLSDQTRASHKVEEVTDDPRHPLSAYLCCMHFQRLMGAQAGRWAGCAT